MLAKRFRSFATEFRDVILMPKWPRVSEFLTGWTVENYPPPLLRSKE